MMLNEDVIRTLVGHQNFEQGETYYRQWAVQNPCRRGDVLMAKVEGSQFKPYEVKLTLAQSGLASTHCTCPAASGGHPCKHIAAVLIAYVRQPEAFVAKPGPAALLKDLSVEQVKGLWEKLLEQQPEIAEWLETAVAALTTMSTAVSTAVSTATTKPRHSPLNKETYRRQLANILHGGDFSRSYQTIWGITQQLSEIENQARDFLEGDDPQNAIAILAEIAEQVIPNYEQLEGETELADYLSQWSETMAEAILSAVLTPSENAALLKQVEHWYSFLADYGSDESIQLAYNALKRGWTKGSPDDDDHQFTELKLRITERKQDPETYLAMCLKENAQLRYTQKLVTLGRIDEAYQHALSHIEKADEMLALAQTMQAAKAIDKAYELGVHALTLPGHKVQLGKWLAMLAESLGHPDIAVKAWQVAFETYPELESFQQVKRLSDDHWQEVRHQLIKLLETSRSVRMLIEVLLEEGEIERATAVWDENGRQGHVLLEKLVSAAAATMPDWAIREALKEANNQIDHGSGHYGYATDWLKRIKAIYVQHQRFAEWSSCINQIRTVHSRKRSLIPMLKGL